MSNKKSGEPHEFYSADTYRVDESLGWLVKQLMQSIVHQADRLLGPHDLTHAQWGPLLRLRFMGPSSSAALGRELDMDAGALTRLLDRLEAKRLIRRERSSEDRRVVIVSLSEEGSRLTAKVPAILSEVFNAHLAGFSHEEWRTLIHLLQRAVATGATLRAAGKEEQQDENDA